MEQIKQLQPHEQRVVAEKADLDGRIHRLGLFFDTPLYASLDYAERDRQQRQYTAMQTYSNILQERIVAFGFSF
jgi:hypothetical protein